MKIALFTPTNGASGVDQTLRYLGIGLARKGHEVIAAIRPDSTIGDDLRDAGVRRFDKVADWWIRPYGDETHFDATLRALEDSASHLERIFRSEGVDLVLTNSLVSLDAMVAAANLRIPHVTHIHALYVNNIFADLSVDFANALYRLVAHHSAAVVVPAKALQKQFEDIVGVGNVHTVFNGVDTELFRPLDLSNASGAERLARRLREENRPEFRLISLGTMNANKNQKLLIEALAKIVGTVPEARAIITGGSEPAYELELRQHAAALGVANRVDIRGHTEDPTGAFNDADIVVNSSLTETFPLSLLEGMACGKPALVTPTMGGKEIVRNGIDGFVVSTAEEMAARALEMHRDRALMRKLGENARNRVVSEFSANKYVDDFERVLLEAKDCKSVPPLTHPLLQMPKRPPRVLVVVPNRDQPTFHICIKLPFARLLAEGALSYEVVTPAELRPEHTEMFDVLWVLRTFEWAAIERALAFQQACKPVIFETDDNYFALAVENGEVVHGQFENPPLQALVENADLVVVHADAMEAELKRFNPNVVRQAPPQVLDIEPEIDATKTRLRIGFMGTLKKDADFSFVTPALKRILKRHDVELEFMGFIPQELHGMPRVSHVDFEFSYLRFLKRWRGRQWDIGLAPLADTQFNRSKTNNKYREYAAAGIAGVYSDIVTYRGDVRDRVNGLVAKNTPEAWEAAIEELIVDASLRKKIAAAALADVRKRCDMGAFAEGRMALIRRAQSSPIGVFAALKDAEAYRDRRAMRETPRENLVAEIHELQRYAAALQQENQRIAAALDETHRLAAVIHDIQRSRGWRLLSSYRDFMTRHPQLRRSVVGVVRPLLARPRPPGDAPPTGG